MASLITLKTTDSTPYHQSTHSCLLPTGMSPLPPAQTASSINDSDRSSKAYQISRSVKQRGVVAAAAVSSKPNTLQRARFPSLAIECVPQKQTSLNAFIFYKINPPKKNRHNQTEQSCCRYSGVLSQHN